MDFILTSKEKSQLIGDGVITVVLLLLVNLAVFILIDQIVHENPGVQNGILQIKTSLAVGPRSLVKINWRLIFVGLMFLMDAFSTYCRVLRRYHQIELKHIINELHYIASGHLEHQIPFELKGQMQEVVNNINALVGATTNAMEEERAIKRSKDELITSVGHDLRTPLTSIIGYLGLLENKQYRNQEDILKYAHTAYLKSKEMKTLVDDLFEYAKMNKLESLLKITTIDLCEMLQQIGASFELEGQKQDVKIEVKAPDSPVGMEADGQKLARDFTNLVSNALKYGKGATKITLELREVSPTDVEIKVSNNGKKIPEEAIDNIFKRFYRAESSRSRETGGTGLGLAIAEGIVDLHSGTIVVDSNDDLTTFTIRLPKIHPKKAANTN